MELYLDSANLNEIREGASLGFIDGITTTPTFMQREGIADVDKALLEIASLVPVLQIEALGNTADEIIREAHRQLDLGLDPQKTVFKVPVSLEAVKACYLLRKENLMVNVHLVYTVQQAYMAMHAGASYVCPLIGRLQDQGHDAIGLVEQCVNAVNHYGYPTRIMFSSVRHSEHVRNAINAGAHTITVPLKILKSLTENHFTTFGTEQFIKDTRLMTRRVKDVIRDVNPLVNADLRLKDAIVKMTEYGYGCVTVVNGQDEVCGVLTDGDLRRLLQKNGELILDKRIGDLQFHTPISIEMDALLNEAVSLFKQKQVDTILVTKAGKPAGMLDIQDI